jgi:hypothetical protein
MTAPDLGSPLDVCSLVTENRKLRETRKPTNKINKNNSSCAEVDYVSGSLVCYFGRPPARLLQFCCESWINSTLPRVAKCCREAS